MAVQSLEVLEESCWLERFIYETVAVEIFFCETEAALDVQSNMLLVHGEDHDT